MFSNPRDSTSENSDMARIPVIALFVLLVAGGWMISYATSLSHRDLEPISAMATLQPDAQDTVSEAETRREESIALPTQPTVADYTASPADVQPVAEDTSSPSPAPQGSYKGKVGDLPDVAQALLNFTPADSPNETNSDSIRDRVVETCGLSDYVGSPDFPGTIKVSLPEAHGWVRVTWKPGKCGSLGGASYPNPTLNFEISADQENLRYPNGSDSAAYWLTH